MNSKIFLFFFLISVWTQFSFSRKWFSVHEFVVFLLFLLLKYSFNPWWSGKNEGSHCNFLLSIKASFVTEYMANCWEEGRFFWFWWNIPYISYRSIRLIISIITSVSLFSFWLDELSICEIWILSLQLLMCEDQCVI